MDLLIFNIDFLPCYFLYDDFAATILPQRLCHDDFAATQNINCIRYLTIDNHFTETSFSLTICLTQGITLLHKKRHTHEFVTLTVLILLLVKNCMVSRFPIRYRTFSLPLAVLNTGNVDTYYKQLKLFRLNFILCRSMLVFNGK